MLQGVHRGVEWHHPAREAPVFLMAAWLTHGFGGAPSIIDKIPKTTCKLFIINNIKISHPRSENI
jgi:hypothetical protein